MKKDKIESLYAITYQDDGPSGLCSQVCSITKPWRRLYLFDSEDKFREYLNNIDKIKSRKNPQITGIYYPKGNSDEIFFINDEEVQK